MFGDPTMTRFGRNARRGHWCGTLALWCSLVPAIAGATTGTSVVLAFVGETGSAAYQGAQQGLEEAQAQGEFLGQQYTLVPATADRLPAGASAVVAAVGPAALRALAAAHPEVAILNVSRSDDRLRRRCVPNLLHIPPSREMKAAAVAQWRQANPGATGVEARAWDAGFEKYAAAQLNKRYRNRFETPMDDAAWAGWAAVKLVSDMVAREQPANPAALLAAVRERLAFDGQKGVDMSFRKDGQLRQPLLLIAGSEVVGEAPVRGVADIEDLDSLGRATCPP